MLIILKVLKIFVLKLEHSIIWISLHSNIACAEASEEFLHIIKEIHGQDDQGAQNKECDKLLTARIDWRKH